MNQQYDFYWEIGYLSIESLLFLTVIVIKFIYFNKIKTDIFMSRFIKSFFRIYTVYHKENTSNPARKKFMNVSNSMNVLFWLLFFSIIGTILIYN